MKEFIMNIDWKFVVGDIIIPIGLFVLGCFVGSTVERKKNSAKSTVKGNSNTIIQNSNVKDPK